MTDAAPLQYSLRYTEAAIDDVAQTVVPAALRRFLAWPLAITLGLLGGAFVLVLLLAPTATPAVVVGVLLLLNALYWPSVWRRTPRTVTQNLRPLCALDIDARLDEEGVLVEADGRSSLLRWRETRAAWERPDYFVLARNAYAYLVLPKAGMSPEIEEFVRSAARAVPL